MKPSVRSVAEKIHHAVHVGIVEGTLIDGIIVKSVGVHGSNRRRRIRNE